MATMSIFLVLTATAKVATASSGVVHQMNGLENISGKFRYDATDEGCENWTSLSTGQSRHCQLYRDHAAPLKGALNGGLEECRWQLKRRRWNCSAAGQDWKHFFDSTALKTGNREAAFLQAVGTASVARAIARSCKQGELLTCGCSKSRRPDGLRNDWIWGGCGDNLRYGYKFSQGFMDVREKELTRKIKRKDPEYGRSLMALHNNEAGRSAVLKTSKLSCKCHGVSGSCTMVTCWHQLPTPRQIGDYLKGKYEKATKVKVNKKGRLQIDERKEGRLSVTDLVYLETSPDYCAANATLAYPGTKGRTCSMNDDGSGIGDGGYGSCSEMCCGGQAELRDAVIHQKCNCKFVWCCYVQCQSCSQRAQTYTCK